MAQKRIIVEIDNNGEVTLETKNYSGPICLEESQFLKELLGEETSKKLTPEYYDKGKVKKYQQICG